MRVREELERTVQEIWKAVVLPSKERPLKAEQTRAVQEQLDECLRRIAAGGVELPEDAPSRMRVLGATLSLGTPDAFTRAIYEHAYGLAESITRADAIRRWGE